ncbi:DUF6531 domain-containing protein [Paenibacillus elgii]|uniref:DUF6531 domain-containing protein n=1 Tax=Paenibacillus elgii TaxID=189691 RepID=UPI0013D89F55|nr:DUF6531 domain-containing protein [Paenibacillus elgii]NEN86723.1 hypothetical protein [Paenibacillus elgii]
MKRIISSVLSLILFFSLITPTLAAEKDFLDALLTSFKTDRSKGSSITNASSLNGALTDKIGSAIGAFNSLAGITDSVYGSVYDSVYKNRLKRSLASQPIVPPVNLKPDESPYLINSEYDSVSTLSGSLSIQTTDMTINGRNGLSFSLTRTYNSIDANMYAGGPDYDDYPYNKHEIFGWLGTGWTWDLPHMQYNGENWFIHLAGQLGSGTYEIDTNTAIGEQKENPYYAPDETYLLQYPWKNLKLSQEEGYYLIRTLEGITYHFKIQETSDSSGRGYLTKISDAYNNEIRFDYEGMSWYTKKLKSISTDDPSQTITVDYHAEGITLTKGDQKVQFVQSLIKSPSDEFFFWGGRET